RAAPEKRAQTARETPADWRQSPMVTSLTGAIGGAEIAESDISPRPVQPRQQGRSQYAAVPLLPLAKRGQKLLRALEMTAVAGSAVDPRRASRATLSRKRDRLRVTTPAAFRVASVPTALTAILPLPPLELRGFAPRSAAADSA